MAATMPPPPPPPPPMPPMPPPPGAPGVEVVNISVGNPPPPRGNMPGGAPPQFQMPLQFAPGWAQQPQNFDPEYRGFVIRKALPEPGQRFNWNRVRVTEFQVPLSDLNAKGREARWKQTVTNKYDSLRTDAQRNQIDDLVADQNQKEPNPFAEWHLAEIEVRMREFLVAPFRKATETSQIRVILKKVPRTTARPWDEGRPRVFDIDKPPQQQQFQPLPPPQMMPPPPLAPGAFPGGALPPIQPVPAPPQVVNGGNKTNNTQGPANKSPPAKENPSASKSPKTPNAKNKESRSSSPPSQRRRNESKDRLDTKLAKLNMLLNAAGINDSNRSEDDSEYDSDDSIEQIERLHHKKKGKHVKRVPSKSRLPLIGQYAVQPPPIARPARADNYSMSGALPISARGRPAERLTRDHLHRLESVRSYGRCMGSSESLNGGQRLKERVVREKFASSDSDSWEDVGSHSSGFSASSSHYSGTTPPSSLGSGHYRKAYRDRERSVSRSRNPRSARSRSRVRYYEHRKPPSYGRPRSESDSYSSDDSFRERTVKTKEVHHHHWRPQPATTFTDPFRGGQIAPLPRPIQPPPQPRAITYTEPQQHQPAYIPPAPVAPGAYAQQPTYQQQGVQAQNYMDRRDNRSSYPTMAREVADAFERGREKQRDMDEERERRRRLDELRREERERVDHINDLRRVERGSVISGISTAPPSIPPGYGYIGSGAQVDYRHHYPRPRSRSRDRYNRF